MSDVIQRSFAGGELAPALYARADVVKYQTGLRTCRNFQVQRHGGVANRAGTRLTTEVKDSTKRVKLLKFVFNANVGQTYVLEFGNLYMRIIRLASQLLVTDTDAPAWSGATNYIIGDLVTRLSIRYYCILAHTNQQPPNVTYWYPLTGNIYEIPTPYLEIHLQNLRIDQSADVVTINHPSYDTRELARFSDTRWTLSLVTFAPTQAAPTGIGISGTAGATTQTYAVTAIKTETYEESLPLTGSQVNLTVPAVGTPITVSWTNAAGAAQYAVYRGVNGVYGFIGLSAGSSFVDTGIQPNTSDVPPTTRNPFSGAGNFPACSGYYQQRHLFAGSDNKPETVYGSKSGSFKNFTISTPLQDDDSVTFNVSGNQVNRVVALIALKQLIVFTEAVEWSVAGDSSGVLRPGEINPNAESYTGSSNLAPILIGNTILYVQARQSIIRDLVFDIQTEGYKGNDLTLFATHLFDNHQIVDWDYSQIPNSTVWTVREDGIMTGLTYIRDQLVWGWHRHDTAADGRFENVCVIPEGNEDVLYVVVNRVIQGNVRRYIERMNTRFITDVKVDAFFVDSGLSYDGRNDTVITMKVTGGVLWDHSEFLTLTASAPFFSAAEVGNAIVLNFGGPLSIYLVITAFTDNQHVTVRPAAVIDPTLQNLAITDWARAVDEIGGISHLEGQSISVLGDGNVVANGVDAPLLIVSGGKVTLDRPYVVIHAGLPITADLETLDIDTQGNQTQLNKTNIITRVDLMIESSRGLFAGPDVDHLTEIKQRQDEDYGEVVGLKTGLASVNASCTYGQGGRVFVRQKDPLPLSILAAIPVGYIGGQQGG